MLKELTVKEFMSTLASDSPVPGGGSAAALNGAVSAGLIAMVASLTIGRKGCESAWEEMKRVKAEMETVKEEFLDLMDEDADSYAKVIACFKLPKESDEEKAYRADAIREATIIAAETPLRIAEKAALLFDAARFVIENGNKNAVSDGAVAAMTARTCILGALYNVRINAASLKDSPIKSELTEKADALEAQASEEEKAVLALVDFG
jgi:methenyltetrahydrofolate cyclohydrolase